MQDLSGNKIANQPVIVPDEDMQTLAEVYTNQFSLYRTGNLSPGLYHLVIERDGESVASIEISITDSYLFEQNLEIPDVEAATPDEH